jgi:hypothetical protein
VFDEHPLALGNALKQFMELLLVRGLQWPERGLFSILELDVFGEFLQFEFNAE